MASIIIGRQGQQPLQITQSSVSRQHCRLTRVGDAEWEIEDLGSRYGTCVNGLPIVKSRVGLDTPIMLADFETSVRQLLNLPAAKVSSNPGSGSGSKQAPAERISVAHLERIYDQYQEDMKALMKKRNRAQVMRMLPMQLGMPIVLGVTGIVLGNDTEDNMIKGAVMVGIMALSGTLSLRMFSVMNNQTDEQFELNQQFQIDYVCPKCKNFFGAAKPYRALLNQGRCPHCKSEFIEKR